MTNVWLYNHHHTQDTKLGVLSVLDWQWDWQCLCSTRMQVESPVPHSGSKDPALLQLCCQSQLWFGSDSWPRNSIHYRVAKREKKKKKEKEKKDTETILSSPKEIPLGINYSFVARLSPGLTTHLCLAPRCAFSRMACKDKSRELFWAGFFIWHNVFEIHLCCCVYQ